MAILILTVLIALLAALGLMYSRRAVRASAISESQERFREWRRFVKAERAELSRGACGIVRVGERIRDTALYSCPGWSVRRPIRLGDVEIAFDPAAPPPPTGRAREYYGRLYLPRSSTGSRYSTYSRALHDLDKPTLFENRLSYRILSADCHESKARLTFGLCDYFEMIDVAETLSLEYAMSIGHGGPRKTLPQWLAARWLGYRQRVGDPTDVTSREVIPSINTVTLRVAREGSATYFLHLRDDNDVAVASGLTHVIPCGSFQPSSRSRVGIADDFDLEEHGQGIRRRTARRSRGQQRHS